MHRVVLCLYAQAHSVSVSVYAQVCMHRVVLCRYAQAHSVSVCTGDRLILCVCTGSFCVCMHG